MAIWTNLFPTGPSLLLTSPSGRNIPMPAAVRPARYRFIMIPQPLFLHTYWTPRETQNTLSEEMCTQESATPMLDALADGLSTSVDSPPQLLPVPEAPTPASHQWSSSCSLSAESSPIWLSTDCAASREPELTASTAMEELPLPATAASTPANATRRWSLPSFRISSGIRDYKDSRETCGRWSLAGAENLTPTLRESVTLEEELADSHERMRVLMFGAALRDAGKDTIADNHKRMSLLMEKTAKYDAIKNQAGLFTPPPTPAMENADLEANWPQESTSATYLVQSDNSGDIASCLLSRKITISASKNIKTVEGLEHIEVAVAPEVAHHECEAVIGYWMPEAGLTA
ncbi:hypothetical protein OE88DRAFT_1665315 [Heliocybe sulcata]|uniref:Uncharacterized protein n=1 Tax=Heliocybe sulcata TaxID=5364 RepID=A0A5C3MRQ1_9AGAM|nr:hypothetical protein OE88DRAFT_1665315 [Heliocybe sulcata]